MQTYTEENYLKVIYHLSKNNANTVQTNAIAEKMQTRAASVTDMLKKLSDKELVHYIKYQGVTLTETGNAAAVNIIRKHRLWEVFLVEKLRFKWDEVHELAEELEHVNSTVLIDRLEDYLDFPKRDPHGDPIPDKEGIFEPAVNIHVQQLKKGSKGVIIGVTEHSSAFLKHLEKLGLTIGISLEVKDITDFDGSIELAVDHQTIHISKAVAQHILVKL
ncbi:metal-dependent transcriptional regulator [Pedobacter sp. AW31-3R]|uniref:metal-dependent transcriptional regulator n=1 Tax=Pedobacter sp. AW31-3R TaxID=3445781 RepID=UPI003FA00DD3